MQPTSKGCLGLIYLSKREEGINKNEDDEERL